MMITQIKMSVMSVPFLIMTFLPVWAQTLPSDEQIQARIISLVSESSLLQGNQIEIHVKQRLVVLTGKVRFYEQKLNIERIAWTSPGVFEVDNKLRINPLMPLSDKDIKDQVMAIMKTDDKFHISLVSVIVDNGNVIIQGSFLDFRDPSRLKHQVATIEGVRSIKIDATFLVTPVKINEVAHKSHHTKQIQVINSTIKL
ncbi:MAG: BON domain-containing protein [Gammaproteobacteria bacterium]|nr:BON domain-containing protein [Gammaproteobacteria bacterium]